jgi:glycosyltransferase involved in cell wall biosynthesis
VSSRSADSARPRVLYVSYDGVLEPLGESQVVAYIERLSRDFTITLLTYEKAADLARADRVQAMRTRLKSSGIAWTALRYHRWPPVLSTAFDIVHGLCRVLPGALKAPYAIAHARSYVPAVLALMLKRLTGSKFVFDMRGFWVDEKADSGQWPHGGALYRLGKRFERAFFTSADAIVSLTRRGVDALPALGYVIPATTTIAVIPTCTDLDRFRPRVRGERRPPVAGCVGTLSNWYLREQTLAYLAWLGTQIDDLQFLMITREDHATLRRDAMQAGIPEARLTITAVEFRDMPVAMQRLDLGVFFIRPCFSKLASAATKLGEFLASGIPVVINEGIGDSGDIVRRARAGVVLADATPSHFAETAEAVRLLLADDDLVRRCREAAEYFSLDAGVDAYRRLYASAAGESWKSHTISA